MNISSLSEYKAYNNTPVNKKRTNVEKTNNSLHKKDTVELSNVNAAIQAEQIIDPEKYAFYASGDFLNSDQFEKQWARFIELFKK